MSKSCMVSVIIPVFNRANTVVLSIKSVIEQTYSDWELIVSDDASTDNTKDTVSRLAKDDERIKLITSNKNSGVAHARNLAVRNASGKYLAFLDSDDIWMPGKLEKQVQVMEALGPEWGASYTGAIVHLINRKKTIESRPEKSGDLLSDMLKFKVPIWTPTFMVKTVIYREVGGMDECLRRHQDLDFYRKVAERYKVRALPEPLSDIFLYTNKRFELAHIRAKEIMFERYWGRTVSIHGPWVASRVWGREWLVASGCMFRAKNIKLAIHYFIRALKTNPFQRLDDYARLFLNIIRSFKQLPEVDDAVTTNKSASIKKTAIGA